MYTLYSSKGSSALAVHVMLEEVGAPYDYVETTIAEGATQTVEFLALNPKARVPVLDTPHGVLTENSAILPYLARAHPEAGLGAPDDFAFARALEFNAYLAATVHPAFAHMLRGARWSDDPAVIEGMKVKVPANIADAARLIEDHYLAGPWVLGERYSIADVYCLLMHRWMEATGVSHAGYPTLAAHRDAMLARPSVTAAMTAQRL